MKDNLPKNFHQFHISEKVHIHFIRPLLTFITIYTIEMIHEGIFLWERSDDYKEYRLCQTCMEYFFSQYSNLFSNMQLLV